MIRPRNAAAAVAVVVALLLTACTTVPQSGPVQTPPVQARDDDSAAVYYPNGPADNMSPAEIVGGFVQAASAGRDYRVAKEFLTDDFARSWRPNARVLVHTKSWAVTQVQDDRVHLEVPTVGQVAEDGRFTPSSRSVGRDFQLVQVRGQWRIAAGPSGVVLTQQAFQTIFKPALLRFFDPSYKRLVPDLRWLPTFGRREAGIVQALLGGQARELRDVTVPVFPAGTRLAEPVSVSDGLTRIDVVMPGAAPDERTTDRMQQAIAASFDTTSTPSVRLSVNGRLAPVARQPQLEQPSITGPVVVADGRFGALTAQGVREDRELGPRIAGLKPRAVTVSARQRLAAVLTGGGQVDVVDRKQVRLVDQRPGLVAPTVDQLGWTYSVPAGDPAGLRVTPATGRPVAVQADLGGSEVVSIEASSDGTRLLVLYRTDAGLPVAYVAGIERDAKGVPIGLSSNRYPIALGSGDATDATWIDQANVAVLSTTPGAQSVVQQQVGGIATPLGPLLNAQSIVGATRVDDLRALLGTGEVVRWSSNAFPAEFPAALRVDVLAVQR